VGSEQPDPPLDDPKSLPWKGSINSYSWSVSLCEVRSSGLLNRNQLDNHSGGSSMASGEEKLIVVIQERTEIAVDGFVWPGCEGEHRLQEK
jgi:hypothetical protein